MRQREPLAPHAIPQSLGAGDVAARPRYSAAV